MMSKTLLLTFAAMIWGAGFIATKWTLHDYGPYWSNGLRFVFAGIIILPFLIFKFKKIRKIEFYWWPFLCSIILFLSMQAQTIGLKYTSTAKSGFITALYAFFVPIILMFTKKYRYKIRFWFLLFLCLSGIALLCNLDFENFNNGDLWTLACAFLFAWHIVITDKIANDYNPVELNGYQCVFVALISVPISFAMEGGPNLTPLLMLDTLLEPSSLSGFIILGLFSSNIAFSIQAYAQKSIPAHIVALIFLLESIFAAIFGYLLLNEKLTPLAVTGCALVVFSLALVPKLGKAIKT
jgi:drug/metabolite transporter (DMT)-like permease